MLGWSDLTDLAWMGFEIGAHTHSHPQLDIIERGAAWDEVRRSRGVLEDRLGRPVRSFAYPFGFHGARIRALVERAGFTSACAVKDAISGPGDDPLAIARVIVPGDADVATLADLLAGRGRPQAWRGERASTKAFRVARRCAARARRLRAGYAAGAVGWEDDHRRCGAATALARTMRSMEAERVVARDHSPRDADRRQRRGRAPGSARRRFRRTVLVVRAGRGRAAAVAIFATRSSDEPNGRATPGQGRVAAARGVQRHQPRLGPLVALLLVGVDGCTNLSNNELEWYVPRQVKIGGGDRSASRPARSRSPGSTTGSSTTSRGSSRTCRRKATTSRSSTATSRRGCGCPRARASGRRCGCSRRRASRCPEVDIFEIVGERPNVVEMHTHWMEDGKERQRGMRSVGPDFAAGWHTFGLDWKPDSLTWYVDGVRAVAWSRTTRRSRNEPMYLVANLAVGGDFTKSAERGHGVPRRARDRVHQGLGPRLDPGDPMTAPSPPEVEAAQRRLFKVFADRRAHELEEQAAAGRARRRRCRAAEASTTHRRRPPLHVALLSLATILWLWALQTTDIADMGDYGLLSALHAALLPRARRHHRRVPRRRAPRGGRAGCSRPYLVLFVAVVHASPVILYGTLRYAWAWKHVGVVDYFMRHHSLNPDLSFLPVYQNWPGFFGLTTTLTEAAGHAQRALVRRLGAAGVRAAQPGRGVGDRQRAQPGPAGPLHRVLVLPDRELGRPELLRPAGVRVLPLPGGAGHRAPVALEASRPRRASCASSCRPLRATAAMPEPTTAASSTWGTVGVLCVIFAAVATSHPLTPLVLTAALFGLAIFGVLRVRSLPLIMLADDGRLAPHRRPHVLQRQHRVDLPRASGRSRRTSAATSCS